MPDVAVIDDPAAALVALDPVRARLLAELASEPASAAGVAARVGLPRQKVGYHLRALQEQGLVVEVEQRRHGGLTERVLAASAGAYVVSPSAMGALAARVVREVGTLVRGAERAGKRLPTLSIDTDIRFRSADERAAFAAELAAAVRSLASRYHDESAAGGRWHRVVVVSHPRPAEEAS